MQVAKEIERKFLVKDEDYKKLAKGIACRQGYLNSAKERTVRVRTVGGRAFLAVKGPVSGATRDEYEYEIPLADGQAMLETLAEKPLIEKIRYTIPQGGLTWEIDEFLGENLGLTVAEIELSSEGQKFDKPTWLGEEVTRDPKYFNSNLVKNPYAKW